MYDIRLLIDKPGINKLMENKKQEFIFNLT